MSGKRNNGHRYQRRVHANNKKAADAAQQDANGIGANDMTPDLATPTTSGQQRYKCYPCDLRLGSMENAFEHATTQHNGKVHTCYRCQLLFESVEAFSSHKSSSNKHWICDVCTTETNNDYTSLKDLRRHRTDVHHQCFCGHLAEDSKALEKVWPLP